VEEDVVARDVELALQQRPHLLAGGLRHFHPDDFLPFAHPQLGLDGLQQVLHFVFAQGDVRVAEDAERHDLAHVETGKEVRGVQADQLFDGKEALRSDGDEPRERLRDLDERGVRLDAAGEPHGEVERAARQERQWMSGIDRERCEDRRHARVKLAGHRRLLFLRQPARAHDAHAGTVERMQQFVEDAVHVALQRLHALADGFELLPRRQAVHRAFANPVVDELADAADAHHQELVEIRGRDAEEFRPLEQRHVRALSLGQHAPVELEPAQFAIEKRDVHRVSITVGSSELAVGS
jgi:hypothetical protein